MTKRKIAISLFIAAWIFTLSMYAISINSSAKGQENQVPTPTVVLMETVEPTPLPIVEPMPAPTPEPYFKVTPEERELLAKVVYEEGNIESLDCQKAIASVIFNRVQGGIFGGNTINDVVYCRIGGYYQFSVVPLLSKTVPNKTNYEAVDYVIQNGPTLPYYVCFFRSAYYFRSYTAYCNYDNTYFSYKASHVELLKPQ